jgi:hypothetical protein
MLTFLWVLSATAGAVASEGITVETPAGPVTCAPDPANEPGPEAISATPLTHGSRFTVTETGGLRCQTSTFGEVEVSGAGLPWRLTVNEKRLTAKLAGSPRPGLLLTPVGLPILACLYEARKIIGTVSPGTSPTVTLRATHVRLSKEVSNPLCPALGPAELSFTLP